MNYALLKIVFIKEMRTTRGDKEVPQTFFHNSLYFWICDLNHLLHTVGNPAFRNFMTSQKAEFCKNSRTPKNVITNW